MEPQDTAITDEELREFFGFEVWEVAEYVVGADPDEVSADGLEGFFNG